MMIQAWLGWLEVELGQISTPRGGFRFVGALGGRKKCGFPLPNILYTVPIKSFESFRALKFSIHNVLFQKSKDALNRDK